MYRFYISQEKKRKAFRHISDEELAGRYAKTRDPEIISELFNRYIHLVFAVCMKYMRNELKAGDFAMEIFEGLEEKLAKFELSHFRSWLLTTSRNTCLMALRRKQREFPVETDEFIRLDYVEKEDAMHPKEESKIHDLVLSSLKKLKEGQRKCLDLMYLQDKSYKEIALITGYSEKEVKSYIQNGKRNLRNMLNDDYEREI